MITWSCHTSSAFSSRDSCQFQDPTLRFYCLFLKPCMGWHHSIYLGCCPHMLMIERCRQNTRCSWFFQRAGWKPEVTELLLWPFCGKVYLIIRTAQSVEEFQLKKFPFFYWPLLQTELDICLIPIYCVSLCFYFVQIFYFILCFMCRWSAGPRGNCRCEPRSYFNQHKWLIFRDLEKQNHILPYIGYPWLICQ